MGKSECSICAQRKGKRVCPTRQNKTICPSCCAELRGTDCGDCTYYEMACRYAGTKTGKSRTQPFIAEIDPDVEEAVDQAFAFLEKGNIEEGEAIIRELEEDHPRNHEVLHGKGLVHAFKNEYAEAIKYFDKAIDVFPYCVEAHFNKAVAYKASYDVVNMAKAFKEVIALGDPETDLVRQAKEAIKGLEQSVGKTEGIDLDTYIRGGEIFAEAYSCMEKGEWQKALAGFQACLSKNKKHVQSYGNMGLCYAELGQREKALEALNKALELDPGYEPALINRMVVKSMRDGEGITAKFKSVAYYKDRSVEKKCRVGRWSLFRKLLGFLGLCKNASP